MHKTMIEYKDNRNSRASINAVKPVTTLKHTDNNVNYEVIQDAGGKEGNPSLETFIYFVEEQTLWH